MAGGSEALIASPSAPPYAVLYPAIAEASRRARAGAVGLIAVGACGPLDLDVDRVHIRYDDGQTLGHPASPMQCSCSIVRGGAVPARAIPRVVARAGVDRLETLPDAIARVPEDALPVVTTTWALSAFPLEERLRFLQGLGDAAAARTVAWISAEGVGVAPAIPTLGDRRASGHSIVGLAVFDRAGVRAEAIGRCWSRGRWLEWLAAA